MKRRMSLLLVLVMVVTSILSGCGSSDTQKKEDDPTSKATTAEKGSAEAETAEKVKITFQTWNPGEGDATDEIIAAFEEKYPNIDVEYVYMPYTDHVQDLKIDMASGAGADVYGMQTGAQYLEFRDFQVDLTPFADKSWGADWQGKFVKFCMDLLNEEDHYYGFPLGLTYAGFAWADVNYLAKYDLKVPTSLSELKEVATVLRKNNEFPMAIGAKDDWINIDVWMSIVNDINSKKLYSALEGETEFNDADLVKSFEIWQSLFTDGVFQDGALGVGMYNDVTDLFEKEGSVPMYMNGSWAAGIYMSTDEQTMEVMNSEGADHDAFLIDWNDDGKVSPVTASVDVVLCMNSNTKHQEEAWTFIDYMLHEGQDVLINKYLQYSPSRTDLVLNVEGLSEDGKQSLAYTVEQSKTNIAGYREMAYPELKQAISDVLKELALDACTPEEAGQKVEKASKMQVRQK
jgi:ABC-type glycerol-3-phosphate transport system substrate-binding protein